MRNRPYRAIFVYKCLWPAMLAAQAVPDYSTLITGHGSEEIVHIAAAPDGGTTVFGNTSSLGEPWTDDDYPGRQLGWSGFVLRYDVQGKIVLRHRWANLSVIAAHLDADGGMTVAGRNPANQFQATVGAWITEGSPPGGAYVARLAPDGSMRFGTHVPVDIKALTVDRENNVVVCGTLSSFRSLPTTDGAFARNRLQYETGYCAKFSADLSSLLASTYLNAPGGTVVPASVTIDTDGAWLVTGQTDARWWELVTGFQNTDRQRSVFRLGEVWTSSPGVIGGVLGLFVDPGGSSRLYASTGSLKFASSDEGATWEPLPALSNGAIEFAVHPRDSRFVAYNAYPSLRLSSDGGRTARETFRMVTPPFDRFSKVLADPAEAGFFYLIGENSVVRVGPAGFDFSATAAVRSVFPRVPDNDSILGIVTGDRLALMNTYFQSPRILAQSAQQVWAAPSDRNRFYLQRRVSGVPLFARTDDAGATWLDLPYPPITSASPLLAIDPRQSGTLYIGSIEDGVHVSRDGGESWARVEDVPNARICSLAVDYRGTLWAGSLNGLNGFIGRFSPDATQLLSASVIGGSGPSSVTSAVPAAEGRYWIAGTTLSSDFPVSGAPLSPATRPGLSGFAGLFESSAANLRRMALSDPQFVVGPDSRLHFVGSDGEDIVLMAYDPTTGESNVAGKFGGSRFEGNARVALGTDGRLRIAGGTASSDFPVTPNAAEPKTVELYPDVPFAGISDGFLLWLSRSAP